MSLCWIYFPLLHRHVIRFRWLLHYIQESIELDCLALVLSSYCRQSNELLLFDHILLISSFDPFDRIHSSHRQYLDVVVCVFFLPQSKSIVNSWQQMTRHNGYEHENNLDMCVSNFLFFFITLLKRERSNRRRVYVFSIVALADRSCSAQLS
jgi:hypothetical protein